MKNNWDKDRRCPSGSGNMLQEKNLPPNATLFRAAETHCLSALPLCVAALRILASFTQVEPQDAQEISLLKACQHWSAKAKCPTTFFVFLLLDDFQRPRNQSFWHMSQFSLARKVNVFGPWFPEMPNNTIQKLDPRVDLSGEFGKAIWPNSTSARQNYKTPLSARLLKLGLQVCRALDKCPNAKMVCVLNSSSSSRPTRNFLVSLQSK